MAKKNKSLPGIIFTGDFTVKGDMFNIHDNNHVHITVPNRESYSEDEDFEYVDLMFFDKGLFGVYERQLALRKNLSKAFKRMLLDSGRDLVAVFIAYHYLNKKLVNMKDYTNFIQDIDGLMPEQLTKIKKEEDNRSLKYKSYAESLALECEKWFIDKGCLPDIKMWKSSEFKYQVDDERRERIQDLVTDILKGMKKIIG